MTDHYAETNRLIDGLHNLEGHNADFDMALAQVHATLALAEQQRIANLIALWQDESPVATVEEASSARLWPEVAPRGRPCPTNRDTMTTFKREKPHVRIDRIGRKLTPIERAAEALVNAAFGQELPEAPIDLAKAVLDSIDTNQLANALLDVRSKEIPALTILGSDHEGDRLDALELALAVKNWLTGKDQQ